MANKKELPQEMLKALGSHQLGDVSGGKVLHAKLKGQDIYFIAPDFEEFDPNPLGAAGLKIHGNFSGPYYSKEEAIEAAKKAGCTSTEEVEWEAFNKAARNQN